MRGRCGTRLTDRRGTSGAAVAAVLGWCALAAAPASGQVAPASGADGGGTRLPAREAVPDAVREGVPEAAGEVAARPPRRSPRAATGPTSRLLSELNWMEVRRLVPDSFRTVLLPVGTLEAHGVIPNGADILVPDSLAARLAPDLRALVAPTIAYGVNTSLDEYAGTFGVTAEALRETARQVLGGLAGAGFRNVVVLNGHGPNYGPLNEAARQVFRETDARILVVNWWSITPDVTGEVFGTTGGHAGVNETAAVLAIRPDLVHPDLYEGPGQATAFVTGWQAWPFPSSIGLYEAGAGYPDFDRERARRYFDSVTDRVRELALDVIAKWDRAGL